MRRGENSENLTAYQHILLDSYIRANFIFIIHYSVRSQDIIDVIGN